MKQKWKLEDAKARFSEVVRLAHNEGPQHVTVRGRDSVVVISVEDLAQLRRPEPEKPLVDFLEGLLLTKLDISRDDDRGRDIEL